MQKGSCSCSNEAFRPGAKLLRAAAGRLVTLLGTGFCAGLLVFSLAYDAAAASQDAAIGSAEVGHPKRADYGREKPSKAVRHIADWALDSGDHHGLPVAIVDKTQAKVYVFKPDGHLRSAAPVLLGLARGDDSTPGIGNRELSDMPPEVRTTPAGRFEASLGRNASRKDVLWVDYETAISMHRVINSNPKERRPHRLATPTPLDNRISYGCINVPIKFFDDVISTTFEGTNGIVYVLPEVYPMKRVFAEAYDVDDHARTKGAGNLPAVPLVTANAPPVAPVATPTVVPVTLRVTATGFAQSQ